MADTAKADAPTKTDAPQAEAAKAPQAEIASDPEEDDLDDLDGRPHTRPRLCTTFSQSL
jgi:hypothetical protein